MDAIAELNKRFAITSQLNFTLDTGGLIIANIDNDHASATIALQGAHLLNWMPVGAAAVIWLSPDAKLAPGKSIRGGIPVCWPWFGAHPDQSGFPAHGFVRTANWEVTATNSLPDGATQITFTLPVASIPAQQWPYVTALQYQITIGKTLTLVLITRNNAETDITISEALHTYFYVHDVRKISIEGLDSCQYLDKVDGMQKKQQTGAVTFASEVDRVYLDTGSDCIIHDAGMSRQIRISKNGSQSSVVWNPWIEKSAQMGDMGTDGYLGMVCVESANAANNCVTIPAGGEHRLQVCYSIETI